MEPLPTELVGKIFSFLDPGSQRVFRHTCRTVDIAGKISFVKDNFSDMQVTVSTKSLKNLVSTTSHHQYGLAIQRIIFKLHGLEILTIDDFNTLSQAFEAFFKRNQKVAIKVTVTAVALCDSQSVETTVSRFMQHIIEFNHHKRFAEGPICLELPSNAKHFRPLPRRNTLYNSLANLATIHNICLSYPGTSDSDKPARIEYNSHTKCLVVSGLGARQLREVEGFITNIDLHKLTFRKVDIDFTTLSVICESRFVTLKEITIVDANLYERWSLGDFGRLSWNTALETMKKLPGLISLTMVNLWNDDFDPNYNPAPQISHFSATGFATLSNTLMQLIATTK